MPRLKFNLVGSASNLNPLGLRNDIGALWENFLTTERIKLHSYKRVPVHSFFWRTVQQQKIDLIEELAGQVFANDFICNSKGKGRIPVSFLSRHKAKGIIVHRKKFRDLVLPVQP